MISSLLPPRGIPRYNNTQPDSVTSFETSTEPTTQPDMELPNVSKQLQTYRMTPNSFGIVHEYTCSAGLLPQIVAGLHSVNKSLQRNVDCGYVERIQQIIYPFQTLSEFRLAHWFHTGGSNDAQRAGNRLINDVICAPRFHPEHLQGSSMERINTILDGIDNPSSPEQICASDNWRATSVTIRVPSGERLGPAKDSVPPASDEPNSGILFEVPGLHHRSLLEVIRARFTNPLRSSGFVYTPYKKFQTQPDSEDLRVRDELYTCDAWLEEHKHIQHHKILVDGAPCQLEHAIVALMVWSDPTQVTQFDATSVSPVYVYFGNQSTKEHRMPTSFAAEHVSYSPKVRFQSSSCIYKYLYKHTATPTH